MSDNAAVNILAGRLVTLRQEFEEARGKLERAQQCVASKRQAIEDVEGALRTLGLDPATVEAEA